jgi:probable addiction module antidote protein
MGTKNYDDFLLEQLRDPELAAEYLTAALEDEIPGMFLVALRNVAEAQGGIAALADATDLNRQTMYRTLSSEGNPTFATLLAIVRAVGLNLTFTPATPV